MGNNCYRKKNLRFVREVWLEKEKRVVAKLWGMPGFVGLQKEEQMYLWFSLNARHCPKCITYSNSFNPCQNPRGYHFYLTIILLKIKLRHREVK